MRFWKPKPPTTTQLETVWTTQLLGGNVRGPYTIVDGDLQLYLHASGVCGSVVDERQRRITVKPVRLEHDGLNLHVLIDGHAHVLHPGSLHPLTLHFDVEGPVGKIQVRAQWFLRLESARYI